MNRENIIIERLERFEEELLEIVDDCISDWSYIEREYHRKFKELKDEFALSEEDLK